MRTRTARITLATAALAAASLALSACGSSGPSDPNGAAPASADAATMWALSSNPGQMLQQNAVDEWNKANPDSPIKVEYFEPDAYKTKVRTAIGAGQGPTFIFGWSGGVLKSYIDAGEIKDLSDFVKQNPAVKDRYIPSVFENGVFDGKTYALPNNYAQPIVLYYNKKTLEKAGVQPPTTWEELMAAVPKLTQAGVAPISLAGQSRWTNMMWLEYLTDRIGGPEVFQAIVDGKPNAWSDPAIIKANTMIQELVDAGGFVKGFSSIAAGQSADQALLYTGKAGFLLQGAWAYSGMKANGGDIVKNGDLGWVAFPAVTGGQGDAKNIVGNPSNFWSVSSKANEKQTATAENYLKSALLNDAMTDGLVKAGSVPVVNDIESKLSASDDKDFLNFVYGEIKGAPSFQLSWDQALSPAEAEALLTNLEQLFLKQVTPQQFSDNMNATIGK